MLNNYSDISFSFAMGGTSQLIESIHLYLLHFARFTQLYLHLKSYAQSKCNDYSIYLIYFRIILLQR